MIEQIDMLRVATDEQKEAFLENVSIHREFLVKRWLASQKTNLYLELDRIVELKYRKHESYTGTN